MAPVAIPLSVKGAQDLRELTQALKDAGAKDLQKELYRGINRAMKPLKEVARKAAREGLPKRGGLADTIARSKITTRRVVNKRRNMYSVRLVATSGHDIRALDRGKLRWPVFPEEGSDRSEWTWKKRDIKPGWWSEPLKRASGIPREEILQVMADVKRKLEAAAR
ncbi:MAG TPA: hypothetical protein VGJ95_14045 [Pseudonocardiaceae bacterium]